MSDEIETKLDFLGTEIHDLFQRIVALEKTVQSFDKRVKEK